jgi:hypothetical protein
MLPALPNFEKNVALAFFVGHLTTNPMLSVLRLQGLRSNIYVHFQLVNKQIDWDFIPEVEPLMKDVVNLEMTNITKSSLTSRL